MFLSSFHHISCKNGQTLLLPHCCCYYIIVTTLLLPHWVTTLLLLHCCYNIVIVVVVSVMVTIIMIDSDTNKPIDALDSIALLEENNAEQQLSRSTGLEVSEIMAQESEPRPQGGEEHVGWHG